MKKIVFTVLIMFCYFTTAFAEMTTLSCNFPEYSDNEGKHKVKDKFVLTFFVEWDNKSVYMVGNLGSTKVQSIPSEDGMTLIEVTPVGNVMTTTVDLKHRAVHSRHTVMFGELVPSQYYGTCETK